MGRGGTLVYSALESKAYSIKGTYSLSKNKLQIRYRLFLGNQQQGKTITLPAFTRSSAEEIIPLLAKYIREQIERERSGPKK
jgi:hypothetical protein